MRCNMYFDIRRQANVICALLCYFVWNMSVPDIIHAQGESRQLPRSQILVIGKVSDNPKKHYKTLKPIAEYVVAHMKDLDIKEARILMAKDNRQMIDYLRDGKVDWVTETPFSAVIFQEKAGAEMLLRKWKDGVPDYHTVFITRKDGGITSLADLRGKTIAFEDSGSTSAYFLPAAVLNDEGLDLIELDSTRKKPPAGKTGFVFSGGEINTSSWVYDGKVDAGAYSSIDWETDHHLPEALKKGLKVFHRTKRFPRSIELVRKDIKPEVRQRLREILLNAHNDPGAKSVLRAYNKTAKFDELDDTSMSSLKEAARLLNVMGMELN